MTGGKIGARLMSEAETNLAINVIPGMAETYEVQGRGELQLGMYPLILHFFPFYPESICRGVSLKEIDNLEWHSVPGLLFFLYCYYTK